MPQNSSNCLCMRSISSSNSRCRVLAHHPSKSQLSSGRSPGTIWPLASSLAFFFFIYRAGRLEQFDHLRVPSHFIIGQVAWNNLTTCEFPRILSSGRSPGTIRPLTKFFASIFTIGQVAWNNETTHKILWFHFHHRAVFQHHHCFSLQNLLCKVKRKWIFQCLCTVSIVKRGQLL